MQTEERLPLLKTEFRNPQHEVTGSLLMVLSALLFGISGMLVRYATAYHGLAFSTAVLIRGAVQSACSLLGLARLPKGRKPFPQTRLLWGALTLRGGAGALSLATRFASYKLVDFNIATAISKLSPMLVLLFSSMALREPVTPRTALAAFLSLLGAILVTDPFTPGAQASLAGVLLALTSAAIAGLSLTTLRAIATHVHFLAAVLSLGVFTVLAGLVLGGTADLLSSALTTGIAMLAALSGFTAQCAMSKGYEYITAGKGALVRNIGLPLAYILGIVFLGEVPNVLSVVGGILILVATLMIGYEAVENERLQESD